MMTVKNIISSQNTINMSIIGVTEKVNSDMCILCQTGF